jgi:hypothetical protein
LFVAAMGMQPSFTGGASLEREMNVLIAWLPSRLLHFPLLKLSSAPQSEQSLVQALSLVMDRITPLIQIGEHVWLLSLS